MFGLAVRWRFVVLMCAAALVVLVSAGCCQKKVGDTTLPAPVAEDLKPGAEEADEKPGKLDRFSSFADRGQFEEEMELGRSILADESISIEEKIGVVNAMRDLVYAHGPATMAGEFEKEGYQFMRDLELSGRQKAAAMLEYVKQSVQRNVDLGRVESALRMLEKVRDDCSRVYLNPEVRNWFVTEIYKTEKKVERLGGGQ